jgi:hypothetical protein
VEVGLEVSGQSVAFISPSPTFFRRKKNHAKQKINPINAKGQL